MRDFDVSARAMYGDKGLSDHTLVKLHAYINDLAAKDCKEYEEKYGKRISEQYWKRQLVYQLLEDSPFRQVEDCSGIARACEIVGITMDNFSESCGLFIKENFRLQFREDFAFDLATAEDDMRIAKRNLRKLLKSEGIEVDDDEEL